MAIKRIPLSELEHNPARTLRECCDNGQSLVVELPDHRLVSIQALDPDQPDPLIEELLESDPNFQALLQRSKASPRKPFSIGTDE